MRMGNTVVNSAAQSPGAKQPCIFILLGEWRFLLIVTHARGMGDSCSPEKNYTWVGHLPTTPFWPQVTLQPPCLSFPLLLRKVP